MKKLTLSCLFAGIVIWLLPLWRGVSFLIYTQQVYSEESSINALNDFSFAQNLLTSYFVCIGVTVLLSRLLVRTGFTVLWIPVLLAVAGAIVIIIIRPEEVILIFPLIRPLRPAASYLVLGFLGAVLVWIRTRIDKRLRADIQDGDLKIDRGAIACLASAHAAAAEPAGDVPGNDPDTLSTSLPSPKFVCCVGVVRAMIVPLLTLLLVSLAGGVLVVLRIAWTRDVSYLFLVWNLILAWLPLVFALCFCRRRQAGLKGGQSWLFAVLWLLFLPNAPYIFTDLIHLHNWFREHYWVDLSLILLFALTGFLLGFLSLYLMQQVVAEKLGHVAGWLFVATATGLSGFGIYVGRFLRWNSWAVLTNPLGLTYDLGHIVAHPRANYMGAVFPMLFATFLFLGYLMLYALTHLQPQGRRELGG